MVGENIKEILKTPIPKLDKPILSFKRANEAAAEDRKTLTAFNGYLGA